MGAEYRGYDLGDLDVVEVRWRESEERHLASRRRRYPDDPDEADLVAEWATQAATDPWAAYSLTRSGDFRVLGWSPSAPPASWSRRKGRVLRVILEPDDLPAGRWRGITAAPASQKAAEHYWRRRTGSGVA